MERLHCVVSGEKGAGDCVCPIRLQRIFSLLVLLTGNGLGVERGLVSVLKIWGRLQKVNLSFSFTLSEWLSWKNMVINLKKSNNIQWLKLMDH